jgi:hypothetical protein
MGYAFCEHKGLSWANIRSGSWFMVTYRPTQVETCPTFLAIPSEIFLTHAAFGGSVHR